MTNEAVQKALFVVYGGVPQPWAFRLNEIADFIENKIPHMFSLEEKHTPLSTYLIYAKGEARFDLQLAFNVVFSEKMKNSFCTHWTEMKENSKVQVNLDVKNLKSEVNAFGSIESAIVNPHLDISPIYRYTTAIQQSLLHLVDEDLVAKAVLMLRTNPYLFFAYGEDYVDLMPITWEDI